jgi:hypothetical protein
MADAVARLSTDVYSTATAAESLAENTDTVARYVPAGSRTTGRSRSAAGALTGPGGTASQPDPDW